MIPTLNAAQTAAANQMQRNFPYGTGGQAGFAQLLNDMLASIAGGNVGIGSTAWDVDSLCLDGGAFSQDADTTSGLTFGYFAGGFYNGLAAVQTSAGTIALTASTPNYVEVDSSGTVHASLGSFTAGRLPLYTIVTGASAISSVAMSKTLLTLLGPGSVTGAMLSAGASSRRVQVPLGTLTGTASYLAIAPVTGTLTGAVLVVPTNVAANNTNYWTFAATELGAGGSGSQALLATGASVTTQSTGGFSLTANVPYSLPLVTLSGGDTQRNVTAGDVIQITFTATSAPTALTGGVVELLFSFTD